MQSQTSFVHGAASPEACPCATVGYLGELGAPQYDPCEDNLQNVEALPILDEELELAPK